MKKAVLLRVGIDTGSGGIYGPVFEDRSFEFICIPGSNNERTYGNTLGRTGRRLIEYFPPSLQDKMVNRPMHVDPEFATFTYGDPTTPKAGLRRLERGDILAFYCGLKGWGWPAPPALYLVGYFEVELAGVAEALGDELVRSEFGENAHVQDAKAYRDQRARLVVVKGSRRSRLLTKAVRISAKGKDRLGRPLHVLSEEMQEYFGHFGGHTSIQRSPPRWIDEKYVERATEFIESLE